MPQVILDMTAPQAVRASAAINAIHRIPQIDDPDFVVDPENPNAPVPQVNEFSDMQWAKIQLRRVLTHWVLRHEKNEAELASGVVEDPNIAT